MRIALRSKAHELVARQTIMEIDRPKSERMSYLADSIPFNSIFAGSGSNHDEEDAEYNKSFRSLLSSYSEGKLRAVMTTESAYSFTWNA